MVGTGRPTQSVFDAAGAALSTLAQAPGDRKAASALYRAFYPVLLQAGLRYARGNVERAEDVVQGVFLRLWESRRFGELGNAREALAYLLVAIRNSAIDRYRREHGKASSEETETWVTRGDEVLLDALAQWQRLPEQDREMLRMRVVEGTSIELIAQKYDLNYASAAQRLSRARRKVLDE